MSKEKTKEDNRKLDDALLTQKSQAKMIEKLLLKIKKLKQNKMEDDFSIFNLDRDKQSN